MSRLHLDADALVREIDRLISDCPEIADDEVLRGDMVSAETDATEFLSRVARAIRSEEAMVDGIKDAARSVADTFKLRQAAAEKRVEGLRALAYRILVAAKPNGPVRLPEATLSIAAVPSKLVIEDEAAIPENCFTPEIKNKLNREAVAAFIANGVSVPGAKMSTPSTRLNVRWV